MPGGRPTKYSDELATKICERIAGGESLKKVCEDKSMPVRSTVHLWLLDKDKKEFSDKYELACNIRAENMFDDLNNIADLSDDQESHNRSRLRVDTRKWYLSKVMPKKFGEKLDLTSKGGKLPTPIMTIPDVHGDDSNEEDSDTEAED